MTWWRIHILIQGNLRQHNNDIDKYRFSYIVNFRIKSNLILLLLIPNQHDVNNYIYDATYTISDIRVPQLLEHSTANIQIMSSNPGHACLCGVCFRGQ